MSPADLPPQVPPTLRISIRRVITAGIFSHKALAAPDLSAVTTVRFDNATIQPGAGFVFSGNRWTSIAFPDPATLQLIVRPAIRRLVRGHHVAIFVPSVSSIADLGVLLANPSAAVVGEISQVLNLGTITVKVVGTEDGSVLHPHVAARPFALKVPPC